MRVRHGYFGIQEQGQGRKVVLFSVWDPDQGNNPNQVPEKERVEVLYHAEDVLARRFGGEGTGGQSFFEYPWKVGTTYRFLVKAVTAENKTSFAGYFYLPEKKSWKHLVTFRTITGGTRLESPHSFIEDFRRDGRSTTRSAGQSSATVGSAMPTALDAARKGPLHGLGRFVGGQRHDRRRDGQRPLLSANRRRHPRHHETEWLGRLPGPQQAAAGDGEVERDLTQC